jgi:hypothetical protein
MNFFEVQAPMMKLIFYALELIITLKASGEKNDD